MKQKFSKKWIGSRQPRKQRKYRANAPLHIRRKFMSANLKKDLRKKHGKRNFPLRKGDKVKVMRGQFRKREGKISLVDLKKLRVAVEGIQRAKKDGTKFNVWFTPSNLQIQELDLDDKKRRQALERKSISSQSEKETDNINKKLVTKKQLSEQKKSSTEKEQISDKDKNKIKEKNDTS